MMPQLSGLKLEKVAVLAGAGVSVPSGIASGQMFNNRMLDELLRADCYTHNFKPLHAWRREPGRQTLIRFEQFVGILRDFIDPQLSILGYLEQSWQPTGIHDWLAEAMCRGAHILTTNIDSLIEVAYWQTVKRFPQQVVDVEDWAESLLVCPDEALFKLHGTLRRDDFLARLSDNNLSLAAAQYTTDILAVTLDSIGRLEPGPKTFTGGFLLPEYIIRVLEQVLCDRDLLVIGYSGSDDFDIKPSLRLLRPRYRRIIWIDHREQNEIVSKCVGAFVLIRGRTLDVLDALFGELPRRDLNLANTAVARFNDFVAEWARQIFLDDMKRRVACAEILRQAGYSWQAVDIWQAALDELPYGNSITRAKLAMHVGQTCISGHRVQEALEYLQQAKKLHDELEDSIGSAQAHIGVAAALYDQALLDGEAPNEALTELATVMPKIHRVRQELETREYLLDWPPQERQRLIDDQKRLEVILMRGALTLSRIARHYHLVQSRELVRDVTSRYVIVAELLEGYGRFPAVHEDKLLYVDYIAELSLVLLESGRSDEFEQRCRELRDMCRLLGLRFRLAMYFLDLATMVCEKDRSMAAYLYSRAGMLFQKVRNRTGLIIAARGEAQMRGQSPDEAEKTIRFKTLLDDWWMD